MAFPNTELATIIKAYIGADPADAPGSWPTPADWSSLLIDKDISVFVGRRPGTVTAASGSCSFWLDDSDLSISTSDLTGTPVSLQVDDIGASPPYGRFFGYIVDVTTEVIPGAGGHELVTAKVTLGGIMRQRTQGAFPLSALRRAHVKGTLTSGLIAYWPMEDATTGDITPTSPTFDLVGRYPAAPLQPSFPHFALGGAVWSSEVPVSSVAAVQLTSARMVFNADSFPNSSKVPFPVTTGQPLRYGFGFRLRDQLPDSPNNPGEYESTLIRVPFQSGTGSQGWAIRLQTSSSGTVFELHTLHLDSVGSIDHITQTAITIDTNEWHYLTFTLSSSGGGADTAYRTVLDDTLVHAATATGVTYADSISFRSFSLARDVPGLEYVAHMSIWAGSSIPAEAAAYEAFTAHAGEMAHDRIERVFTEDEIPYTSTATLSQMCGPQPIADPITIARDAEIVDHGILAEDTSTWGLTYRAGRQRYGQDAAFTIDLASYNVAEGEARPVLRPTRNDQRLRNEWTISRPGGSSITVRDDTSITKRGRRADSATVNVASDDQLQNEAAWRVHEGTYDGRRWGSVPVNFGENLTLLTAWLTTELGDRVDRTGHALTYLERLDVQGYTQRLRKHKWTADLYVEPYAIFDTGTYEDTVANATKRYDTLGSTLTAQVVAGTATSFQVTIAVGYPLWTLTSASWSGLQVEAGGVIWDVVSISGSSSPQTFTVTQTPANDVSKTVAAGTQIRVAPQQRAFRGL